MNQSFTFQSLLILNYYKYKQLLKFLGQFIQVEIHDETIAYKEFIHLKNNLLKCTDLPVLYPHVDKVYCAF